MARTAEGTRLTILHRQRQIAVRAAAQRDLLRLWRTVDPTNLAGTIGPFSDAAAAVVTARHGTSGNLAAAYYQRLREVEGARGTVMITVPDPPMPERSAGLIRGASLSGIIRARRAGFTLTAAASNGYVKAAGSTSDLVLSAARELVTQAAQGDPRARGWRRVTGGKPCPWCAEAAQDIVSEGAAGFSAHNHDACVAEPVFD